MRLACERPSISSGKAKLANPDLLFGIDRRFFGLQTPSSSQSLSRRARMRCPVVAMPNKSSLTSNSIQCNAKGRSFGFPALSACSGSPSSWNVGLSTLRPIWIT